MYRVFLLVVGTYFFGMVYFRFRKFIALGLLLVFSSWMCEGSLLGR